jgi:hypothetical protein
MDRVRPLEASDLVSVAELWLKVYRRRRPPVPASLLSYFADVFLNHPWPDSGLRSLVYETPAGVAGFIGVVPRPMLIGSEPIRAAVTTQLMVDPQAQRPLAAFQLLRAIFDGPQDLTFSDGALPAVLRFWERAGGQVAPLYNLEWTRHLRPVQLAASLLSRRPRLRLLTRAATPFARIADELAARVPFGPIHLTDARLPGEDARDEDLLATLGRSAQTLRPCYDPTAFEWLLRMTAATLAHGALRKVLVRDPDGTPVGGYIYFVKPGGLGKVLHAWGARTRAAAILGHLFHDARTRGALAVTGPMQPGWLRELTDMQCRFACRSFSVLVHSCRHDVLDAVGRGDAELSRLEGEWWMRFGVDEFD